MKILIANLTRPGAATGRRSAGIVKLIRHAKPADTAHRCPALLDSEKAAVSGTASHPPITGRTIEYYRRASHIHGLAVANILHRRKNTVPRRCRSLKKTRLPTLSMQASSSWPPTNGSTVAARVSSLQQCSRIWRQTVFVTTNWPQFLVGIGATPTSGDGEVGG